MEWRSHWAHIHQEQGMRTPGGEEPLHGGDDAPPIPCVWLICLAALLLATSTSKRTCRSSAVTTVFWITEVASYGSVTMSGKFITAFTSHFLMLRAIPIY
jgi:hypothetical protein